MFLLEIQVLFWLAHPISFQNLSLDLYPLALVEQLAEAVQAKLALVVAELGLVEVQALVRALVVQAWDPMVFFYHHRLRDLNDDLHHHRHLHVSYDLYLFLYRDLHATVFLRQNFLLALEASLDTGDIRIGMDMGTLHSSEGSSTMRTQSKSMLQVSEIS